MKPRICFLLSALVAVWVSAAESEVEILTLSPDSADGGEAGDWVFSEGGEFPGASGEVSGGDGTVRLHYDFWGGGRYVAAYRAIEPARPLDRLSFRMKKPAYATFTVRVQDSENQTFQKSATYLSEDWRNVEVDLTHWERSFGGPNDGILRHPVRRIGILVENEGLDEPEGIVDLAEVRARVIPEERLRRRDDEVYRSEYRVTDFESGDGFSIAGPGELDAGRWRADLASVESVSLNGSISLHGTPETLRLTVRGGKPGHRLRLHLGSHFQTFVRDLGELTGERETFSVPVPPEGWDYYGGQNDGEVRPPLRFARLELLRAGGPAEAAQLVLEGLECVTEVTADSGIVIVPELAGVSGKPDVLQLAVRRTNLLPDPVDGKLEVTVRDWNGNTLFETSENDLLASGRAEPLGWVVPFPEDREYVEAEVRYVRHGEVLAARTASRTRALDGQPDRELRPESPWGMGVYLYRYPDTEDGLARMDEAAAMASRAGVQWSREEFSWNRIEVEPGVYDFSFYDEVVDAATRNGISVYGLLAYWSRWTEPYTEEGIEAFADFARAVVRRYKDRIQHWEIYNEPNIFFWEGPRELYPELLKRCYDVIKEEDPEAQVLGISTAGIDADFIRMCLEAEAPFDILTIHPYREAMNEARFMRELQSVAELVGNRPVWITEMGRPTHVGGASERDQALFLARAYLGAVASGASQNISWYNFRNDGVDPSFNEHNFGVLRRDLTPKASYRALATLARGLDEGPWTGETLAPGLYALRAGGALAVWSGDGSATVTVPASGDARAVNLMGEAVDLRFRDGTVELTLEPHAPLFLFDSEIGAIRVEERFRETAVRF